MSISGPTPGTPYRDPRQPAWDQLTRARSEESAKTWLKTELMIAFHGRRLSPATVEEMFAHFELRSA